MRLCEVPEVLGDCARAEGPPLGALCGLPAPPEHPGKYREEPDSRQDQAGGRGSCWSPNDGDVDGDATRIQGRVAVGVDAEHVLGKRIRARISRVGGVYERIAAVGHGSVRRSDAGRETTRTEPESGGATGDCAVRRTLRGAALSPAARHRARRNGDHRRGIGGDAQRRCRRQDVQSNGVSYRPTGPGEECSTTGTRATSRVPGGGHVDVERIQAGKPWRRWGIGVVGGTRGIDKGQSATPAGCDRSCRIVGGIVVEAIEINTENPAAAIDDQESIAFVGLAKQRIAGILGLDQRDQDGANCNQEHSGFGFRSE
jgi:hypothetical protein